MDTTEEQLRNHESRITKLEDGQDDIRKRMDDLSDEVKKGNASNDTANNFLMKQNTDVIRMLGGIQEKKHEAHIVTWQAIAKIAVTVGTVAGLISAIVTLIFH